MKKLQAGDIGACGLLYERHKNKLFAYFYHMTRDQTSSEDLLQLTFEKILRYYKSYHGEGKFSAWMFSIARNVYIEQYNKGKKRNDLFRASSEGIENIAEVESDKSEKEALLYKCLNRLSPEKKELIVMTKINGTKYKEVCEIFNLKESNLKIKIFRIMKELRIIMKEIQSQS